MRNSKRWTFLALLGATISMSIGNPAFGDDALPPFDFSDSFYLENGIDPTTLVGRPNGTPPNSVIDNRPNGPDFNNVRILSHTAAYDDSGHPIFFYVTGLPSLASFTDNSAGEEALEIAETYNVYEFPRATNPQFTVFPKRQDLIADLRNGYFSNDPLGTWKVNLVRFTPAAFNTGEGQEALAELAERNGFDLDGTPLIRTISEVENLKDDGFVVIEVPPMAGGPGIFRWFFCPVIEDPRDGVIAPDAFLEVTEGIPAAIEFIELFDCLQETGDDDCDMWEETGAPLGEWSANGWSMSLPSPNPFVENLTFRFSAPRPGHVNLSIYDTSGRIVRTLWNGTIEAGERTVQWDGRDHEGTRVTSGVYFLRLKSQDSVITSKLSRLE